MTTHWIGDEPVLAVSEDRSGGSPTLFVHGFSHDRHVWQGVVERLSPDLRPLRLDLRGHGESGWSPAGAYDLPDYASDLPRALDGLGIERAAVVAHSLGGNAAILATAAHPDRVAALALIDTGPGLGESGLFQVARSVSGSLGHYTEPSEYRAVLEMTYPLAEPEALDRLTRSSLTQRMDGRYEPRLDPAVLGTDAQAETDVEALDARLWAALATVRCPTLVIRGSASAMLPEAIAQRMVGECLGDGRLETIDGAGHSIMLDAPRELASRLEPFLLEHAVPGASPQATPQTAAL